eukprot:519192-Rhodomonas_salina.1
MALRKAPLPGIPACSFQEQPVNVHPLRWARLSRPRVRGHDSSAEREGVDGDVVRACVGLASPSAASAPHSRRHCGSTGILIGARDGGPGAPL